MEAITVNYKVLDARAQVPAYATAGAAAADLCAVLDAPLTVQPLQRVLVPTGLAIELPGAYCVALVYARSGLSIKLSSASRRSTPLPLHRWKSWAIPRGARAASARRGGNDESYSSIRQPPAAGAAELIHLRFRGLRQRF